MKVAPTAQAGPIQAGIQAGASNPQRQGWANQPYAPTDSDSTHSCESDSTSTDHTAYARSVDGTTSSSSTAGTATLRGPSTAIALRTLRPRRRNQAPAEAGSTTDSDTWSYGNHREASVPPTPRCQQGLDLLQASIARTMQTRGSTAYVATVCSAYLIEAVWQELPVTEALIGVATRLGCAMTPRLLLGLVNETLAPDQRVTLANVTQVAALALFILGIVDAPIAGAFLLGGMALAETIARWAPGYWARHTALAQVRDLAFCAAAEAAGAGLEYLASGNLRGWLPRLLSQRVFGAPETKLSGWSVPPPSNGTDPLMPPPQPKASAATPACGVTLSGTNSRTPVLGAVCHAEPGYALQCTPSGCDTVTTPLVSATFGKATPLPEAVLALSAELHGTGGSTGAVNTTAVAATIAQAAIQSVQDQDHPAARIAAQLFAEAKDARWCNRTCRREWPRHAVAGLAGSNARALIRAMALRDRKAPHRWGHDELAELLSCVTQDHPGLLRSAAARSLVGDGRLGTGDGSRVFAPLAPFEGVGLLSGAHGLWFPPNWRRVVGLVTMVAPPELTGVLGLGTQILNLTQGQTALRHRPYTSRAEGLAPWTGGDVFGQVAFDTMAFGRGRFAAYLAGLRHPNNTAALHQAANLYQHMGQWLEQAGLWRPVVAGGQWCSGGPGFLGGTHQWPLLLSRTATPPNSYGVTTAVGGLSPHVRTLVYDWSPSDGPGTYLLRSHWREQADLVVIDGQTRWSGLPWNHEHTPVSLGQWGFDLERYDEVLSFVAQPGRRYTIEASYPQRPHDFTFQIRRHPWVEACAAAPALTANANPTDWRWALGTVANATTTTGAPPLYTWTPASGGAHRLRLRLLSGNAMTRAFVFEHCLGAGATTNQLSPLASTSTEQQLIARAGHPYTLLVDAPPTSTSLFEVGVARLPAWCESQTGFDISTWGFLTPPSLSPHRPVVLRKQYWDWPNPGAASLWPAQKLNFTTQRPGRYGIRLWSPVYRGPYRLGELHVHPSLCGEAQPIVSNSGPPYAVDPPLPVLSNDAYVELVSPGHTTFHVVAAMRPRLQTESVPDDDVTMNIATYYWGEST